MATCEACNTIPAVVVENYSVKGDWLQLGDLKAYVTGSQTSTKAIIDIYDIFGPARQTLQGADLLAAALNALVVVPDFFNGSPIQQEWLVNPTDENIAKKDAFMKMCMNLEPYIGELEKIVHIAKGKWPAVTGWGALGLCWGGKVTALTSGANTPFNVSGQVHPGRLAAEDAKKIIIPHIVLASNSEDVNIVKEYADILVGPGKPSVVESYLNMHHGWMGARADLKNSENLAEYKRGYNQLASFFAKHL